MIADNSLNVLRVKIWLESTSSDPPEKEWRGEIQMLGSNEVAYFRTLEGFADGIRKLGLVNDDD